MLTYTPPSARPPAPTREPPWLLLLLVFVWLWPGVFSHDLWKPYEPQLFTAVSAFVEKPVWLPELFGRPYFDAPPVYVALSALMVKLLSPWAADAYSAARFATVFFTSAGLLGSGMAGFRLLGRHQGRSVVLVLIGSVGLLGPGHFLSGMSVAFAGVGLCWWGMSAARRQAVFAMLLTGIGLFLLAQACGLLAAAAAWLAVLAVWPHPLWNSRRYLVYALGAGLFGLTLYSAWLVGLNIYGRQVFAVFWQRHLFGRFGGTEVFQAAFSLPYYAQNLLWFALPAWPLALWTMLRPGLWRMHAAAPAAAWISVCGLLLAAHPQAHQDNLVLLLPPLAVLSAAKLDNLRRGATAFLNWFGGMTSCAAMLFLWVGFAAMNYGFPAKLAERAVYFSPYYTRDIDPMPLVVALLCTAAWPLAVRRRHIRGRQAVTNWAAGITLVWVLLLTLFLPWLDAAKSYRPVVQEMQKALPESVRNAIVGSSDCLFVGQDAQDARIAWTQYGYLPLNTANPACRYRLLQYNPRLTPLADDAEVLWHGRRPRNKTEAFAIIEQSGASPVTGQPEKKLSENGRPHVHTDTGQPLRQPAALTKEQP